MENLHDMRRNGRQSSALDWGGRQFWMTRVKILLIPAISESPLGYVMSQGMFIRSEASRSYLVDSNSSLTLTNPPTTIHLRSYRMTSQLPTRQLGKNGPHVTALGFGAMGLSAFYGKAESDDERFKVLDRAYELGERNWDSADMYADSEDLIGQWFKRTGKRNDIFLATKFGNLVSPDGKRSVRSDPEYVKEACDKSLKRLGIDCVDLYYCHRVDGKTPIEKTVEAMAELKKYVPNFTHSAESRKPTDISRKQGRQNPIPWPFRSLRRDAPPCLQSPPHRRRADRVLPIHNRH